MTDPVALLEELREAASAYGFSPMTFIRLEAAIALMRAPVGDGRTYAETCAYSRGYHAGKKAAMHEAGKS